MKKLLLCIPALCLICSGCGSCGSCCGNGNCSAVQTQKEDPADWEITTKVKAEILSDTTIGAMARFVSVSTTDGVVTLTGSVPTQKDKDLIGKIAKKVKGVSRVDNRITVKH